MQDQPTAEQLQLFYTYEEVEAKIKEALTGSYTAEDLALHAQRSNDNKSYQLSQSTLSAMKELVSEGTLDHDTAVEVYNAIAGNNGWTTIEALTKKFRVSVSYKGYEIGAFEDIEADDSDKAIEYVCDNVMESHSIEFSLELDGEYIQDKVDIDPFDIDLDYEAEEL